jgi:Ca2+-binding EF-hand superfamily protein
MRTLLIAPFAVAVAASVTVAPAAVPNTNRPPAQAPRAQQAKGQQPVTRAELIKNLDAQFKALDKNGDGVLTRDELAAAQVKGIQQQIANARTRLDTEFIKLDTNHDGQLSKAEFMAAAPQPPTTAPDVSADLGQFDKNKDGKVTLEEYRSVMLARFEAMDKQHKGTITEPGGATVTRADFTSKISATFKLIDVGGHGAFTKADLQAFELKVRQQRAAAARTRFEGEFAKLDTNHDGQLSRTEFMAAAPTMPAKLPDGSDLLAQLDKNKDGKVTFDEYAAPILARFDAIDTNHDGVLSPSELKAAKAPPR